MLCEKCSKRLKRRGEMERKLEVLISNCGKNSVESRGKGEKVDCLHCGRGFDTKQSLWDHMVAASKRLASQRQGEKTGEWLEVVSNLLETGQDAGREGSKRRRRGSSAVLYEFHPCAELTEEEWFLDPYEPERTVFRCIGCPSA